jgi:hypothetical protein
MPIEYYYYKNIHNGVEEIINGRNVFIVPSFHFRFSASQKRTMYAKRV